MSIVITQVDMSYMLWYYVITAYYSMEFFLHSFFTTNDRWINLGLILSYNDTTN